MNSREVVRRLRSYDEGKPLPRGSTMHFSIAADADMLIVAFVRMGGESRPWGIAFGHPGEEPTLLSVPEGRNRDLVADMCAEFAPTLLRHFEAPRYVVSPPASLDALTTLRQLWLPNSSHLDMLHHLAYAYTFTRWGAGKRGRLNAFGRLCGWLHREASRPGQQHVMVATEQLRDAFTFPTQSLRQGHLGFLLAWLQAHGDRESRMAAAMTAEKRSMSSTLDPAYERDRTEKLLDAWTQARRESDSARLEGTGAEIADVLKPELMHRYHLTEQAVATLRRDPRPENAGVSVLKQEALKEQWYQYMRGELAVAEGAEIDGPVFVASPETDRSPAAAGSRYQVYLASAELEDSLLLHDDRELQAEAIAAGDAFRGTIVLVIDEAQGRGTTPVWRIEDPIGGPLRLRPNSRICIAGLPKRIGVIRSIEDDPTGHRQYVVEIIEWKTKPDQAADPVHVGRTLTFVKASADGISRVKSRRIWKTDGPGAWLTHRKPGGPRNVVVEEAAEDLTVTTLDSNDG
jgi:hypothetical protein